MGVGFANAMEAPVSTDTTTTTEQPTPSNEASNDNDSQVAAAPANNPDEPLGEPGLKALQAEREARKKAEKAAAEALQRVEQFEERDKSELERATERASKFEAELADIKAENLRMRVAAETELPANLRKFLTGSDEESLREQAQELLAATATDTAKRRPQPDPAQGARPPEPGKSQLTRADLVGKSDDWINEQREAGRLDEILGIRRT